MLFLSLLYARTPHLSRAFFAGKCGYFYAMGFRRVNCICPHVYAETHVCIEKSCPFEKGQPFLIFKETRLRLQQTHFPHISQQQVELLHNVIHAAGLRYRSCRRNDTGGTGGTSRPCCTGGTCRTNGTVCTCGTGGTCRTNGTVCTSCTSRTCCTNGTVRTSCTGGTCCTDRTSHTCRPLQTTGHRRRCRHAAAVRLAGFSAITICHSVSLLSHHFRRAAFSAKYCRLYATAASPRRKLPANALYAAAVEMSPMRS